MRCRYCRKELSVLKKLADTDFCSAEHRDLFLQDQQQRMLDLLAKSRHRLKSRRVSARPPLIDPNPAPAPPAHFVNSQPVQPCPPQPPFGLVFPAVPSAEAVQLTPITVPGIPPFTNGPVRREEFGAGRILRGRPRTGPDCLLERAAELSLLGSRQEPRIPRLALHVSGNSIVPDDYAPAALAGPADVLAGASVPPDAQAIGLEAAPTDFVPFVVVSGGARDHFSRLVPRLAVKLFRAKPRAGLADPALPLLRTNALGPNHETSRPQFPRLACRVIGLNPDAIPPAIDRPLSMRPRSGVASPSVPLYHAIASEPGPLAAACSYPSVLPRRHDWVPECDTRLYRMRPRRPVDDPATSSGVRAEQSGLPIHSGAPSIGSVPSGALAGELSAATRLMPTEAWRATVSTDLRAGGVAPVPVRVLGTEPHLTLTATEPHRVERLYRMRPRAGVHSPAAAPKLDAGPALLWECPPVHGPASTLLPCAPTVVERIYRMRPRHPIASSLAPDLRGIAVVHAEPSEIFVMPPVPQLKVVWDFALRCTDRPARLKPPGPLGGIGPGGVRPRGGSEDEEADPALVARSMLGAAFPSLSLPPFALPAPRRPWIDRVRECFAQPRWFSTPALRFASCGVPVLAAIVLYAATTTATSGRAKMTPAPQPPLVTTVASVREKIAARSAVEYSDNFSSGLHDWVGSGNWAETWSYDESGGVKVGAPALLRPTLDLRDYAFDFVAQIEQGGLGFMARAADIDNGYAVKLVVARPGPVPAVDIVRYALVRGKPQDRVQKRLPLTVYKDTIYKVRLDVRDENYSLSVNGQLVDAWTDARFTAGGVGLFTGKGERARFLDVRISHQDDAIGRALAFVVKDGSQPAKRISR